MTTPLITCQDWTDADDNRQWAPTNDPRIVAVIERDDEASFSRCLDGDAILPTYLIDRDRADHVGGYEDDESLAQRIVDAQDRFRYAAGYRYNGLSSDMIVKAEQMLKRWAWLFHGTAFNRGQYGYGNGYDVLIMNTPAFREHVGAGELTQDEAQSWADAMTTEVAAIADGDVYGIGYASFPERVTDEQDIDLDDGQWDIRLEVWGFVGDDYAQQSAGAFEGGTPSLPEMLELVG